VRRTRIETHFANHAIGVTSSSGKTKAASATATDEFVPLLTAIWEDMLRIQPITPDQNYFDLGGDSILAVQMFTRIEQEFKVKLPLATLFDAPTIQELARVLQEENSSQGWSPLVGIKTSGTRPPFFCMHGAGGNVLIYRELSRHLGADQPFYGLQAQGLDGASPPLARIEDMAALYVRHIRKFQPHGPYFLGGYCMGGTIAYEVAQQLQTSGEKVALLALFDTMDWSKIPVPSFWSKAYGAWQRIVFHAANFARLDAHGMGKFLVEKVKVFRNRIPVWRDMLLAGVGGRLSAGNSNSLTLGQIWSLNDQACIKYVPMPFAGAITDFRPLKQYRMYNYPNAKWDQLALGGQEAVVLPVYPAGMLLNPYVEHLAAALKNCIDARIQPSMNS